MARQPRKTSTRSRTSKPATARSGDGIRIRMYRKGLGDCLLLAIPGRTRTFWMLIDCGLILGTEDAADKIAEIVADVKAETGGRLDVLVVTHEHWDHVSGFVLAEAAFKTIKIDSVWMAWTEDPKDKLASRLRREREEKLKKLTGFIGTLSKDEPLAQSVSSVLGFFGFGAANASTRDAIKNVRGLIPGKQPVYWRPGDQPLVPEEAPGVRIYALGPPQDEKALKKTFAKSEVYHIGDSEDAIFHASAGDTAAGGDVFSPFDRDIGVDLQSYVAAARARADASVPPTSGNGASDPDPLRAFIERHYLDPDPAMPLDPGWRRIDSAWLGPIADLALALDNATNNTSLVLAIEIIGSGRVLLMAADAQVGNWLSWHEREWTVDGRRVTGPELLARTVFYKVGHHGSHNATLQAKGLELMTSDELVAFIPVDHDMAVKKGWDEMPLPGLVKALKKSTRGRLLRADKDFKAGDTPESQELERRLKQEKLYFELTISLQ
jgi:hypothetical protein